MDTGEPMTPWVASFTKNLEQVGKNVQEMPNPAHSKKRASKPSTQYQQSLYGRVRPAGSNSNVRDIWSRPQQHLSRPPATYQRSTNSLPVIAEGSASMIPNTTPPLAQAMAPPPRNVVSGPSANTAIAQQSPLVLAAINNSKLMSLRKWIHWVVSLHEIHRYQSVHHVQAKQTESSTASAVLVLRNLQELWKMYTPGRVMLPTEEVREVVRTIHGILQKQKLEAEDRYEEIDRNSRAMTSLEFMEWLSLSYKVAGKRFKLPVTGIFYNSDSHTDQHKELDRAIFYYSTDNSDVMHDTSATNTFSDVIVSALKNHQARLSPERRDATQRMAGPRSDYQILYDYFMSRKAKKVEAEKASRTPQPAAASSSLRSLGDRLLFHHASPSPKKKVCPEDSTLLANTDMCFGDAHDGRDLSHSND